MAIKPKAEVQMSLNGVGQTHGRSHVRSRDVYAVVDEPPERGGSNLGLTPTETLMSALIGCTNVIAKRIAQHMGVAMGEMKVDLTAGFDRRGTMLIEEIDQPFKDVVLTIDVETDATPEQLSQIQIDLAKYCPIAKVIRGAGTTITEHWNPRPMPATQSH